jgi:hypothetical protein
MFARVNLRCERVDENRFESDTEFSDRVRRFGLHAVVNSSDRINVILRESSASVVPELQLHFGKQERTSCCAGVLRVLQQFKYKVRFIRIEIFENIEIDSPTVRIKCIEQLLPIPTSTPR